MPVSQSDGAACLARWRKGGSVLRSAGPPPVNARKMEVQRIVVVKTRLAVWNAVERAQGAIKSELARHSGSRKAAAGSAQSDDAVTTAPIVPGQLRVGYGAMEKIGHAQSHCSIDRRSPRTGGGI